MRPLALLAEPTIDILMHRRLLRRISINELPEIFGDDPLKLLVEEASLSTVHRWINALHGKPYTWFRLLLTSSSATTRLAFYKLFDKARIFLIFHISSSYLCVRVEITVKLLKQPPGRSA